MEAGNSKICKVAKEEPMLQMKSEGLLLEGSLLLGKSVFSSL